jgi:hypothetical protein
VRRKSVILLPALCFACHFLQAGETNAIDPARLAYQLETTVTAYDKIGVKNPKWDGDAKDCLTLFARVRSLTNGGPAELLNELKAKLPHLSALGCEDPLIRYLDTRFTFSDTHSAGQTAGAVGNMASSLQKSQYPAIRKFYGTVWWHVALANAAQKEPAGRLLLEEAAAYLAQALDDKTTPLYETDEACDRLMSASWWAEPTRWNCYRIIEPALAKHWEGTSLALLTKGRAYLSYAWQARGTGYADSVSENSQKLMVERLDTAATALEAAWKLDPHDARICREMTRVELGQGQGRERMETWFQRGMKIDPANYDICCEKLEYLRPRWYGSIKEMIEFGRECTANTNWACQVRLMLVDAHYEASREIQDDRQRAAYWKQPAVWRDIQSTYDQYFKLYPKESSFRQYYALNAARCGKVQEFATQIKLAPTTNYELFGGVERFNRMIKLAKDQH